MSILKHAMTVLSALLLSFACVAASAQDCAVAPVIEGYSLSDGAISMDTVSDMVGCTCGDPECGCEDTDSCTTSGGCGIGGGGGCGLGGGGCGGGGCGCGIGGGCGGGGGGCGWCADGPPGCITEPGFLFGKLFGDCNPCGCGSGGNPWTIGGWASAGYHSNANGLFNNHPDRFNLHQGWLYLERAANPTNGGIDWGMRADVVYGVDAQDTQAFGNPAGSFDFQNGFDHGIYGWALPQLYGELATENVSLIVGHFFTLIGYEVVPAVDNFFYSHSYTMYNSEPFTHTGALMTINAGDSTLYAGWTLGWDTGFDQFGNGNSFLGGASVPLSEQTTFTYITTFGDFGLRGNQGYSHSLVFDTALGDKWNWVLQSDLLNVTNGGVLDHDVGVNNFLFYNLSDCVALGARAEWWHDDGTSLYQSTFGMNIRPISNWVVRPEIRKDWSPALDIDEWTFGIDVVSFF